MSNRYAIGFKFRNEDYIALVTVLSTPAFRFYNVRVRDKGLQDEFGEQLSYRQDTLKKEKILSIKTHPTLLDTVIIDELSLHLETQD